MDEIDKIFMVLEWAEDHPKFNVEFIESIERYYARHGELTEKQIEALDNIIERFGIGK